MSRLRPLLVASALLCGLVAAPTCAQSYPARPVRLVAPFPPGSSADFTSRLFAPGLSELLGQQFIVDNRPGAAGNIGGELVARAAPDIKSTVAAQGSEVMSGSPEQFADYIKAEIARIGKIAKTAGIKAE